MAHIVLTLHGIGEPSTAISDPDPEMWIGLEKFNAVLDCISDQVMLTFDDGFKSCFDIALPALQSRGMVAKFFVTTAHLGQAGYVTTDELLEMRRAGMLIGTHGMHHRPWRRLSQEHLKQELFDAKEMLEQVLGDRITDAACPFGSYDARTLRGLRRSGIEQVFTSDRLPAKGGGWIVPRYTIRASHTKDDLNRILAYRDPIIPWFRQTRALVKRWR